MSHQLVGGEQLLKNCLLRCNISGRVALYDLGAQSFKEVSDALVLSNFLVVIALH
jgi:hypothetical protein